MHDGEYLNCGHDVSECFDTNKGIWWHHDNVNITEISNLPEGLYIRYSHKKTTTKN